MKPSRDEIIGLLQRNADTAVPPADPVFVEQLERRLGAIDLTSSTPSRKRIGRFTVSAVVAGTMIAGAAAAAGVVSWRNSSSESVATITNPPAAATTVAPVPAPTTLIVVPATVVATTSTALLPTPSLQPPTSLAPAPSESPTTTITAPTVQPPPETTSPATTSTEVRIPASLALACTPTVAAISCTWDTGPDGTVQYAVLRTDSASTQGRVFTPEPGSTTYVDTLVTPGVTYVYLVHALDSSQHSIAHSDHVTIACCG
jgi:hypothetical protein